jgi:hypothetical protein
MTHQDLIGKKVICIGKEECYGVGEIRQINPYRDGVDVYRTNEHYRVFYKKMGVFITMFKKDLIFI